jgi:glycosyltransferase involved in cell wall biosynthesis
MWLLRAFAAIPMKVHLDVAGEGPLLAPARTFVRKSGLANRVTFHGWVEGGDVPELMAEARAVVFPSIWQEPAGLVSLEAAAHGRALIASCVGGIPEYVSNASALLVPPNDVSALTTAMESLSRDPDRASRMGRAGRQLVTRDFAMDRFVDRLDTVYNSVMGVPED